MTHVAITVRLLGAVLEHRVVPLRQYMCLGDAPEAVVSFPAETLEFTRDGRGWMVGGHRLVPGRALSISFGRFEVAVEQVVEAASSYRRRDGPDMRLVLATAIIMLGASWVESVQRVVDANPVIAEQLRALVISPTSEVSDGTVAESQDTGSDRAYDEWPPAVGFAVEVKDD